MISGTTRTLAGHQVLMLFGVLLWGLAPRAEGQLSPGPLSEAHSTLEGILQCTNCHALGVGEASFKCLDCHTEIRSRIEMERGYHSRLVESATGDESCVSCHREHNGRDFEILTWPTARDRFDHSEAGYLLEGGHQRVGCDDCHTPEHMSPGARDDILMDLDRSMLGLDTACLSCHEDEHRGQLSGDCSGCHDFEAWSPAPHFVHEQTRFPLTGLHESVTCEGCHGTNASGATGFADIAFGECEDCHRDPHSGGFEGACRACHNTSGWGNLSSTFDFDHSGTRFPLEGAHSRETCASCHETTTFSEPIAHDRCRDCHADYHQGQFTARTDGGDCGGCHGLETFEDSTFTVMSHADTSYPLVGMHAQVECGLCHEPDTEATEYHPESEACLDCHSDSHEGQFADIDGGACETCHTVDGFRPSTYTLLDHASSRFALDGAHLAVLCFSCHTPLTDDPDSGLRFRMDAMDCESCHEDPHVPTASLLADAGLGAAQECEACHGTQAWDAVSGFDHQTTRFALLGAHRVASCASCHEPPGPSLSGHIQFTSAPEACAGCHDDVHDGQFSDAGNVTECDTCHASVSWAEIRFDHERDSSFSLDGAHETVSCNLCHLQQPGVGNANVRVFSGTATECEACH